MQWSKYSSRGVRDRERCKLAIYFHGGGLDLGTANLREFSDVRPTRNPEEP
jgi:hypothetical protein